MADAYLVTLGADGAPASTTLPRVELDAISPQTLAHLIANGVWSIAEACSARGIRVPPNAFDFLDTDVYKDVRKVALLIKLGAHVWAERNHACPISIAAECGNFESLEYMLANASGNKQIGNLNYTLRMQTGDIAKVRLLVEAGADVNASDPYGRGAPLEEAFGGNHVDVAIYLLEKGADPNARPSIVRHALLQKDASVDLVKKLIECGADIKKAVDVINMHYRKDYDRVRDLIDRCGYTPSAAMSTEEKIAAVAEALKRDDAAAAKKILGI